MALYETLLFQFIVRAHEDFPSLNKYLNSVFFLQIVRGCQ
jgi:hypothetical protein